MPEGGYQPGYIYSWRKKYSCLMPSEMKRLKQLEDEIQMARRYFSGTAHDLNTRIESIPSNLVAGQFKFQQASYFEM